MIDVKDWKMWLLAAGFTLLGLFFWPVAIVLLVMGATMLSRLVIDKWF